MHRVAALVHAPQSTFELACAAEVFGIERRELPTRYSFGVCTENPGPVATRAGYDMLVTDSLDALDRAATVIVPGWLPTDEPPSPAVVRALRRAHERGARVVSICSGAFALAHAGLLDGRSATTHWALADEFAARFPAVRLDPDVLYVDHGDVATSAGAGAAIDLCLHLVRADQGAEYAAHVSRNMVMPPHRDGGQLQYAAPPHPSQVDGSLAPLVEWATSTARRTADRRGPGRTRRLFRSNPGPPLHRAARHQPGTVAARTAGHRGPGAVGILRTPGGDRRPPRRALLGHQPPQALPRRPGHDAGRLPPDVSGRAGMTAPVRRRPTAVVVAAPVTTLAALTFVTGRWAG